MACFLNCQSIFVFLYMAIREREKLRDLGMFFKPSFKCFKNEKVNFIQAILKLETYAIRIYIYVLTEL